VGFLNQTRECSLATSESAKLGVRGPLTLMAKALFSIIKESPVRVSAALAVTLELDAVVPNVRGLGERLQHQALLLAHDLAQVLIVDEVLEPEGVGPRGLEFPLKLLVLYLGLAGHESTIPGFSSR
jgi:hypothetical protein